MAIRSSPEASRALAGTSLAHDLERAVEPQHGVQPEEGEHAEQQEIHELPGIEKEGAGLAHPPIGVRVELDEIGVGLGVAPAARCEPVLRRNLGCGLLAGSTSCAPWQLSQVAIRASPSRVTWPWNVSR